MLALDNFSGNVWLEPVARCVLRAVQWIHFNGFVHQDIHLRNVLVSFARDEMVPSTPGSISFKVADLGLAKFAHEINVQTDILNESIRAPEAINPSEFGPADLRMDIYHCGLLLLQILKGQKLAFSRDEILAGRPRQMALELDAPYSVGLEKALRRHVQFRTASAEELWRDLKSPGGLA
jgi:eukaryotic-like serine/threonine-protein kinase